LKIKYLIKKYYRQVLVFVLFLSLLCLYYFFDPSGNSFFLSCPLKAATGYECAGCGVQRAIHSLLHLQIRDAVRFNALFVISLPVVLLFFMMRYYNKNTKKPVIERFFYDKNFLLGLLVLILLFSLFRNTVFYKSILENL